MGIFSQQKSLEELEEDNEKAELRASIADHEYTVAEKRQLMKELKSRGVNPNDFKEKGGGFSFSKIVNWLKTH